MGSTANSDQFFTETYAGFASPHPKTSQNFFINLKVHLLSFQRYLSWEAKKKKICSDWNSLEWKGMTWKFIVEECMLKFVNLPLIKKDCSYCSKEDPFTLCIENKWRKALKIRKYKLLHWALRRALRSIHLFLEWRWQLKSIWVSGFTGIIYPTNRKAGFWAPVLWILVPCCY